MSHSDPDVALFVGLGNLPLDIIAIIIDYLPKCILPNLLYFPPIRKIVVSGMLSVVIIAKQSFRHRWNTSRYGEFRTCQCTCIWIEPKNLKQAVDQWKIYPKIVHIHDLFDQQTISKYLAEILVHVFHINGMFFAYSGSDPEQYMRDVLKFNVKYDCLRLGAFGHISELPPIAKTLVLSNTMFENYDFEGLKELEFKQDKDTDEFQMVNLSSDLEVLKIKADNLIKLSLPGNLREVMICTGQKPVEFECEEMDQLKYLKLILPFFNSFGDLGIVAANLESLELHKCYKLLYCENLHQFQHLKRLVIKDCTFFPFDLFDRESFPELTSFEYEGRIFDELDPLSEIPDSFGVFNLIFPSKLELLIIINAKFVNVTWSSLQFPDTLLKLIFFNVTFDDGYLHLGQNLEYISIHDAPKLALKSSFRVPAKADTLVLTADYMIIESMEFMYHLPKGLTNLGFLAHKMGRIMKPLTEKIKWPWWMEIFSLCGFYIDSDTLQLLNFHESGLERIYIRGGNVKKLRAEWFPIGVKNLSLPNMGIQELSDSFEEMKELNSLSLEENQLQNVNPIKLLLSLKSLDVRNCNLRVISPFLVSMLESENKDIKLNINARENWNLNVTDVRKMLKTLKKLKIIISNYSKILTNIVPYSSRMTCVYSDENYGCKRSNNIDDIDLDCDPEELYNGSANCLEKEEEEDNHDD